ncbi:uncharacterized protein N7459_003412 [Penicillium hispanicum]|uniref:uncharacterized protein n=1 Tax=Penicillium hispanicum TaxID=1080232 RepID=UPI00253FA6E6|nr:uncharacterized protein N7459_003412 [Penicillium hispanicum]KAJ5587647.1 hypothetical protein N7459_003412 [Penicillium hispanicum]
MIFSKPRAQKTKNLPRGGHQAGKQTLKGLEAYVNNIKPDSLGCFWGPAGVYHAAHGTHRSMSQSLYRMKTMATSGENIEYWVKVEHRHVGVLEFKMPKNTVPSGDEVLEELKKQVENLKQKDGKKDEKKEG